MCVVITCPDGCQFRFIFFHLILLFDFADLLRMDEMYVKECITWSRIGSDISFHSPNIFLLIQEMAGHHSFADINPRHWALPRKRPVPRIGYMQWLFWGKSRGPELQVRIHLTKECLRPGRMHVGVHDPVLNKDGGMSVSDYPVHPPSPPHTRWSMGRQRRCIFDMDWWN